MATPRPLGVGQWTLTRNGCGQRSATIPHWFGAPCRRRSQIPPPCTDSPVDEVRLDSWHRGRVVLIGDAAHATAPVWAQGAALAAEDALVLAECRTPHLSDRPPCRAARWKPDGRSASGRVRRPRSAESAASGSPTDPKQRHKPRRHIWTTVPEARREVRISENVGP